MATANSATRTAVNYVIGLPHDEVETMPIKRMMIDDKYTDVLCSYGEHFPLLVKMPDGGVFLNDNDFFGPAYRVAWAESSFGLNSRHNRPRPKVSQATARHCRGAQSALELLGYQTTGIRRQFAEYLLVEFRKPA
jgi:hypothetical protein